MKVKRGVKKYTGYENMKKKVIAAGHICLDITPVFPEKKVNDVGDLLQPGKLIEMGAADVHTGGSVANAGLAMKILGADVSLMGKIGTDEFGDMVMQILKQHGAEEGMIRAEDTTTSYSVVLAMPGIDRMFLHNPGANHSFCADDITEESLKGVDLFHFGYPPIMRKMYLNEGEGLVALFKKVKAAGIATSLDMSSVDADSEAGAVNWDAVIQKVMPYVDFFVPSVEELCFMLDRDRFEEWQLRANGQDITEILDLEKDIQPLAERCMSYGAKVLMIKCGVAGMYYRTADKEKMQWLLDKLELKADEWVSKEGFEKSYIPEKILSATGAGDTSIGAFLTATLEGESIENCMHLAAATGACCVSAYDSLGGLKSFDELRKKIAAGWEKRN